MLLQRATVTHSRYQLKKALTDSFKTTDLNLIESENVWTMGCTGSSSQYTDEPFRKRRRIGTETLGSGGAGKQQRAGNCNNERAALV